VVFLWEVQGGVLFAADTCMNVLPLGWVAGFENLEDGKRTLKKLCDYDFQIAAFGHGGPIMKNAAARWRKRWGSLQV
jgi:glyoxylase-like metal-dependent hydrolase (beta-lactamase superfamily II)